MFSIVFASLPMFICVYQCLPLFTRVYLCLPQFSSMFTFVYPSLHVFTYVYICVIARENRPSGGRNKKCFLYQKIALTSFYPMVLVALQYPFVSLSYKRSRPRSYTAEERRNQAKKSRAMFPFTSVKRSGWSDHTHIIPGSRALRWEMS